MTAACRNLAAIEEELEIQAPAKQARKRAGRQPLPLELPRIEHHHEPESCQCGQCGADLVKIGEDISEQLDVEPARFFVHRNIRPQYACHPCETVTVAPIPPAVIDGGMAANGLLAWVAANKYLDHLPLYRIEQIAARQGVPRARSPLAEWIGRIGVALQPLADRLGEMLRQRACLHADSRACSPPPSSMASILHAGWPTPSTNFPLAPIAESTRCYRSQTLHSLKRRRKVGRLAAYQR